MDYRKYLFSSCVLFAFIFLIHLLIIISNWSLRIENFEVPKVISIIAVVIMGFFSYKSFDYWHRKK